MKKKGFTLVELLAVIVILAIIALIAIPLIGNVIEKAKIGALESSVNGLVESANMYYTNTSIKGETITETTFDFEDGKQISDKKLEYKGKVYNGKLILHASGEAAVCIDDEEHYAYKNKDTNEIVSGIGTCLYDGTTGDFSSNSPTEDLKQQIAAATATTDKVLEGNTIYTSKGLVTGTMANKAGTTTTASTITESGDNALITIPSSGYYDETSKISIPIETIKNQVTSLSSGIYYLGSGKSFNVSSVEGYESFTISNFIVSVGGYYVSASGFWNWSEDSSISGSSHTISKSYNNSTGVLTLSGLSGTSGINRRGISSTAGNFGVGVSSVQVYLVIGGIKNL